jgi:hypothetical protein
LGIGARGDPSPLGAEVRVKKRTLRLKIGFYLFCPGSRNSRISKSKFMPIV